MEISLILSVIILDTILAPSFNVIEVTIDKLIADGFLRCKISKNGQLEILKWNEK